MKADKKRRVQSLLQNSTFAVLAVIIAFLAIYALSKNKVEWDISQNKRSTLTQATVDVLKKIKGPVQITAYATPQDPTLGELRRYIHEFVGRYQRVKPDISLTFIDPREEPKKTTEAGVRTNGEMVIEYEKRRQHITNYTESEMANALMRLVRNTERVVMSLAGHGEPSLRGQANFDLGEFGRQLQNKGFRVNTLDLKVAPEVPDNVATLILSHPRVDLLPGESDKIMRYLEKGGAILWLIDQEPLHGLQPIADQLGLHLTPGIVVDPDSQAVRAQPTVSVSSNYGMHAVMDGFNIGTVYPFARQIGTNPENKAWRFTPLVEVSPRGWVESQPESKAFTFDPKQDVHGPIWIAGAFERDVKDKKQRVIVVGTGHFLENTYLGSLGNLDLGVNMLNWLSGDENLINIQPRTKVDSRFTMSPGQIGLFGVSFLLLVPLFFLVYGGMIWWRRRKA